MIYTDMTRKAINLCFKAHEGQLDNSGVPYVLHPVHVAEQMDTEDSTCVALLHDVVEDTDYTLQDLVDAGFPDRIVEAVRCLTKKPGIDYMEYIKVVKTNPLATKVKLADMEHNSDLTRLNTVTDKDVRRNDKYQKARMYLEND
ncbi:MAG: HD domain-containing protein [Lachnospiraceae bacterium]|nr:HD domain-containing protein [Lachnospiraceae bacterium]